MKQKAIESYKKSLQELKDLSKEVFVGRTYLPFLIPELSYLEDEKDRAMNDLYQREMAGFTPTIPDDYEVHELDFVRKLNR